MVLKNLEPVWGIMCYASFVGLSWNFNSRDCIGLDIFQPPIASASMNSQQDSSNLCSFTLVLISWRFPRVSIQLQEGQGCLQVVRSFSTWV